MRSLSSRLRVSVLFNEPKLLKRGFADRQRVAVNGFSALQRAEIAETSRVGRVGARGRGFSALQRAEIAEISDILTIARNDTGFSALQRAEIAEIVVRARPVGRAYTVSVLFNEPKLLKGYQLVEQHRRAEFQCSSTSRNC